ncbi:Transposase [Oopsacas minuta]|uniref:Transposase n=1 Tax=Oopsacas minuta TaxID=111878 RepID=A0AAV7K8Y3_9METZ|nr:Transposase [Oopsacas minuta]
MAKELKISPWISSTIVKSDFGLSSFQKRKVHFLSDKIKTKRFSRSKVLHTRFAAQELDQFLFTVEQAFNYQNDRILSKSTSTIPDEYRYVKRVQKPLSLMVWANIFCLPNTTGVRPCRGKINVARYKEFILQPIVKELGEMMFENQPFIFQQDGAPAHTANSTQELLRTNIPDFISKVEWPPSSPDLNPLDFSVWSILESSACSKSHNSIESLKQS